MKSSILIGLALIGVAVILVVEVRTPATPATPHVVEAVTTARDRPPIRTVSPRSPEITKPAVAEKIVDDSARSGEAPGEAQILAHAERAFDADHAVAQSGDRKLDVETQIRAALPPGSTVRNVACRSELCRIETTHPSLAEFQRFTEDAFANHGAKLSANPVMATVLGDLVPGQPVVAVAFVGRQGSTALSSADRAR